MTRAASLIGHIERQQREIRSLLPRLRAASVRNSDRSAWNSREVLLHLLGAARRSADDLRLSLGAESGVEQRQAGGEYVDVPGLTTPSDVAVALVRALDDMHASIRGLDDDALGRAITISLDAGPTEVPIGLMLRHGVAEHFDEHIAQLREALDHGARPCT
jgi:hypothetical protein